MARPVTTWKINGITYKWDTETVNQICYDKSEYGLKEKLIRFLVDVKGFKEETARNWIKSGGSGPSKFEAVEAFAEFLGCEPKDILKPVNEKKENSEKKENEKMYISDDEKKIARDLYSDMCDLLESVEYYFPPMHIIQAQMRSAENNPNKEYTPYEPMENKRDRIKLGIRKTSLDIPQNMIERLYDFVDEIFGDFDVMDEGNRYFDSQGYRDYLEENGWDDNVETKEKYSIILKRRLSAELDDIFKDYIKH